jgi:hypothetical protein
MSISQGIYSTGQQNCPKKTRFILIFGDSGVGTAFKHPKLSSSNSIASTNGYCAEECFTIVKHFFFIEMHFYWNPLQLF